MSDVTQNSDVELIEAVLAVLPEIGRNVFKGMTSDPVAEGRSLGQMKVIACLHHNGRLPVKDVAAALGVTMPTASELIDKLVDDGLLRREVNPADRRQVLVALTPAAEEVGRRFHELRRAQIQRAFDLLEPEERPIFLKSLRAWAEALKTDHAELMAETTNAVQRATHVPLVITALVSLNLVAIV